MFQLSAEVELINNLVKCPALHRCIYQKICVTTLYKTQLFEPHAFTLFYAWHPAACKPSFHPTLSWCRGIRFTLIPSLNAP
jgi:hypothetical protein